MRRALVFSLVAALGCGPAAGDEVDELDDRYLTSEQGLATACTRGSPTLDGGPMPATGSRANFSLRDTEQWQSQTILIDGLGALAGREDVDAVLADANHEGVGVSHLPSVVAFHTGFKWGSDSNSCWRPQGLSGSADAFPQASGLTPGGRKVLVASWHDEACEPIDGQRRGTRVTFADVTSMDAIRYRRVLLVEPYEDEDGSANFRAVRIHAGGISWVGRYLYVVDTVRGLRVFDVDNILRANTTDAAANASIGRFGDKLYAYNYKYVLPQIARYAPACDNSEVVSDQRAWSFSWASLDRSTAPPSLLVGEYRTNTTGRLFRYAIEDDGRLRTSDGLAAPTDARYLGETHVQGGFTRTVGGERTYWLSTSGGSGDLRRKRINGREASYRWSSGTPQNLHYSPFSNNLWGLDEFDGRPVWAVKLSKLD